MQEQKQDDSMYNKIAATALTSVFHCMAQQQSYRSLDCAMKLTPNLFLDLAIAKLGAVTQKLKHWSQKSWHPLHLTYPRALSPNKYYFPQMPSLEIQTHT